MGGIINYYDRYGNVSGEEAVTEHRPSRGSDVEAWLKAKRDAEVYWDPASGERRTHRWPVLDALLDEYRLRADTGLLLHQDISEATGC